MWSLPRSRSAPAPDVDRSDAVEPARDVLEEYGLPEHAPVEALRGLTRVAAALCGAPTAVVNLLDGCFQHQVGEVGFVGGRSPRSESMCAAATDEPRLRHVPDASLEPSFRDNPWVDGRSARVRFYASAPLLLADGRTLGSLCVFSEQPGSLSAAQRSALADLAGQAVLLFEQDRLAREAAQQAALFRLVAEGSADVLSRQATDGTVLYVSPSLRTVLGHDPQDEVGRSAGARLHLDDEPVMAQALRELVTGVSDSATVTVRSRHADGSWRWMEVQLAPIRDDTGVLEVHAAARDVTDRVRAERQLAEVAEQSRSVVDTCADALVAIDEDGLVLDWNPAAEATFGWTRDEAVGRDLTELVVPAELRGHHRDGVAALRAGGPGRILGQQVQVPARHRDGHTLPVELTVWRSRWDGGWRYNAFLRDVSERQRAADALAAARDDAERRAALTSAVLETIDVGVVACDAQGALTLCNQAAREFHGMPEDPSTSLADWAGRFSLFAEDGRTPLPRDRTPLVRALTDGELSDQAMVIAPTGRAPRTVRCDGRAMRDSSGRLLGAVVAMKDVTDARARAAELTSARDQALAGTRAKTAFLAAASHEIRTPLNGVLGSLELLSMQALTAQQQEYVAVARRSGDTLLRLLNDVLDLSKAETTSVTLADEPFSPHAIATEVVAALEPVALNKGVALTVDAGPALQVSGDPDRLKQVLMNLVGNAVKFTGEGSVAVRVHAAPGSTTGTAALRLSVTDTGAGMPPEELAALFRPFEQGAQGQRYGGTGLGLALSQQFVDLMGGRIEVTSQVDVGTTFTVHLDLARVDAVTAGAPGRHAAPAPAPATVPDRACGPEPRTGLRVLVVDDSDINLLIAEAMLVSQGVEVTTAGSGEAAVAAVQAEAFDVVLLDNSMPGMSGTEAARAIRRLPGSAGRTRLVAFTASAGEDEGAQFLEAGMDGVLLKPMRLADLVEVLADAERPSAPAAPAQRGPGPVP